VWQGIGRRLLEGVDDPHQIIALVLTLIVSGCAILAGGRAERFGGLILLTSYFAATYAQDLSHWVGPQYGILAVDLVVLSLFLAMALRTDRTWTLFAAGFHLLVVLTHAAMGLDTQVHALAYAIVLNLLSYLAYLALALGTAEVVWRRRRERRALLEMG